MGLVSRLGLGWFFEVTVGVIGMLYLLFFAEGDYILAILGALTITAAVLGLSWVWRRTLGPLVPWYVEWAIVVAGGIGIYIWTLAHVASRQISTRITSVRAKVKADMLLFTVYVLLGAIFVPLFGLDDFPKFYAAWLLLGLVHVLKRAFYPPPGPGN